MAELPRVPVLINEVAAWELRRAIESDETAVVEGDQPLTLPSVREAVIAATNRRFGLINKHYTLDLTPEQLRDLHTTLQRIESSLARWNPAAADACRHAAYGVLKAICEIDPQ